MRTDFLKNLVLRAQKSPKKVVFPESLEPNILIAAKRSLEMGIAYPFLIGEKNAIQTVAEKHHISLEGMMIVNNSDNEKLTIYTRNYQTKHPDFPEDAARFMLSDPLYFGAMMVETGEVDAMVAGFSHTTGEVIVASQMIIGLSEGIETPSSLFLLKIPGFTGTERNFLVFADCAVCPNPTPTELADIALGTSQTVKHLFGWQPRVALLSFSTKGSAQNQSVDNVLEALKIVKARDPDLLIDGELQADAAIIPEVASKKIPLGSPVAGKANILIFPDLNSANIAYKLVQRLAKADAYGPLLQGFSKPVSDLSRGATVEDIIGATVMSVVRAQTL